MTAMQKMVFAVACLTAGCTGGGADSSDEATGATGKGEIELTVPRSASFEVGVATLVYTEGQPSRLRVAGTSGADEAEIALQWEAGKALPSHDMEIGAEAASVTLVEDGARIEVRSGVVSLDVSDDLQVVGMLEGETPNGKVEASFRADLVSSCFALPGDSSGASGAEGVELVASLDADWSSDYCAALSSADQNKAVSRGTD